MTLIVFVSVVPAVESKWRDAVVGPVRRGLEKVVNVVGNLSVHQGRIEQVFNVYLEVHAYRKMIPMLVFLGSSGMSSLNLVCMHEVRPGKSLAALEMKPFILSPSLEWFG